MLTCCLGHLLFFLSSILFISFLSSFFASGCNEYFLADCCACARMCTCDVVHKFLQRQASDDNRKRYVTYSIQSSWRHEIKRYPRMDRGAAEVSWQSTTQIRSCHAQYRRARPANTFVQGSRRSSDVGRHASRRTPRFITVGVAIGRCGCVQCFLCPRS
jgi:hypothetical protein